MTSGKLYLLFDIAINLGSDLSFSLSLSILIDNSASPIFEVKTTTRLFISGSVMTILYISLFPVEMKL